MTTPSEARTAKNFRVDDALWDEAGRYADQLETDRSAVLRNLLAMWVAIARTEPERAVAMVSDPSDVMRRLRRMISQAS